MLILIAVLALLSAAYLFARYARRQAYPLPRHNTVLSEAPMGTRPLFEPSAAELRSEELENDARAIARREYSARAEARAMVDHAIREWRESPSAGSASRLLEVTAVSGLSGDFARAAEEILQVYRESGITRLDDSDMAALLDSHLRLIPASNRDAGALFSLQQEIARLRSE